MQLRGLQHRLPAESLPLPVNAVQHIRTSCTRQRVRCPRLQARSHVEQQTAAAGARRGRQQPPHLQPLAEPSQDATLMRHLLTAALAMGLALGPAAPSEAAFPDIGKLLSSLVKERVPIAETVSPSSAADDEAKAPEVCRSDTRLGKASTAAMHELKLRAALFDETQRKTEKLRARTNDFVSSMWQSLE